MIGHHNFARVFETANDWSHVLGKCRSLPGQKGRNINCVAIRQSQIRVQREG